MLIEIEQENLLREEITYLGKMLGDTYIGLTGLSESITDSSQNLGVQILFGITVCFYNFKLSFHPRLFASMQN